MVLGGDEIGRTQHGNNNAYCQDNEISWFDWEHVDEPMLAFVARLVALRRSDPVLRRRNFFSGPGGARIRAQGHRLVPAVGARGRRSRVVRRRRSDRSG